MIGLSIPDLKDFTNKLFRESTFDSFQVMEADFVTAISITMQGRLTQPEAGREFTAWQDIRPLAFQVIKGTKLPRSFKIILRLSNENAEKTISRLGLPYKPQDVAGFYLNVRYEAEKITCITGCSMNTFTMDKSLEKEWDGVIRRFFRHHQIVFEEIT